MKYLKCFEEYKVDNITEQDIIDTIERNGKIKVSSVKNFPEHIKDNYIRPVDIDGESIIVEIDGQQYQTSLKFVTTMEYTDLNESKEEIPDLIIPKGKELFHSTSEDFDIKNLGTGGYDSVLWTTEDSAISQTYIPVAVSSMLTKTEYLHKPKYHEGDRATQRQLGVIYDYDEVEFDEMNKPKSWRTPEHWKEASDAAYIWSETHYKMSEEIKAKKLKLTEMESEASEDLESSIDKLYDEIYKLEAKYEEDSKDYWTKGDSKRAEYETINKALRELGYKPRNDANDNNYEWDLKMGSGKNKNSGILPANFRESGRLIILKPKEDLRIYDFTLGGKTEGDLMDLDYHKIDLFRKVEKKGYDGIKINDFAQIEGEGNFGHRSIGLFKSAIPKLDVISIPAEHPENFADNHRMSGDYESKEYKAYKKGK